MSRKRYRLRTPQGDVERKRPGRFAGWDGGRAGKRIFGRLDCASGKRKMKPENRVFFRSYEDAVACGFRPCKLCKPRPDDRYERRDGEWHLCGGDS